MGHGSSTCTDHGASGNSGPSGDQAYTHGSVAETRAAILGASAKIESHFH